MSIDRVVLLVEDSADDEELTLRALQKYRIHNPISIARDGQEAIDFFFGGASPRADNPEKLPAVVLLDLHLPRLSGFDVLRRLRSDPRTADIPVVVLTTSREEEDIVRSYQFGANSYIRKPVGFEQFMCAIGQMGLYWLVLNELPGWKDLRR